MVEQKQERVEAEEDIQSRAKLLAGRTPQTVTVRSASARDSFVQATRATQMERATASTPDLSQASPVSTIGFNEPADASLSHPSQQHAAPGMAARQGQTSCPVIHEIYEKTTGTWQYIVADAATFRGVVIDPVLDYDAATITVATRMADTILAKIKEMGYTIDMILETHAHADHITAASYLQARLAQHQDHKPQIGIGQRISQVQATFGDRYKMHQQHFEGVFDKLFDDNEVFQIGSLYAMAIHVPGHTPDHMAYRIGDDDIFTGDCIFHADLGTARADFPGGSPEDLFASGRKLLALPDHVRIWSGHDYTTASRSDPVARMTVAQHKKHNKHLKDSIAEQDFISLRRKRDATLAEPKLLHPSLQMNLRAGKLPQPTPSGQRMLSLPLDFGNAQW